MKNKLQKIIFGSMFLLALTSPAFSQQVDSSAMVAVQKRIKVAGERLKAATEAWNATIQQNRPKDEQNTAQAEWQKAVDEINDLKKIEAALGSTQSSDKSQETGRGASSSEPTRSRAPDTRSDGSNSNQTLAPDSVNVNVVSNSNQNPSSNSANVSTGSSTNQTSSSSAQSLPVDCATRQGVLSIRVCTIAADAAKRPNRAIDQTDRRLQFVIYGQILSRSKASPDDKIRSFLLDAEDARTDKQIGADSNAKGTTSIVVKGGVPAIFNLAAENGAAARSVDGTTVTFRVNPAGFYDVLQNRGLNYLESFSKGFTAIPLSEDKRASPNSPSFQYERKMWNYFRKLSLGFSFDTSRGQTTPTLVANERQLSAFSVRYEFFNERDPRHPKYADEFRNFFIKDGGQLIAAITAAESAAIYDDDFQFRNPELQKWLVQTDKELKNLPNPTPLTIEAKIMERLAVLPFEALNGDTPLLDALKRITDSQLLFNAKEKEILARIAKAPIFTVEYTNHRDPVVPDTHNFNFIYEKGFPMGAEKDSPVIDVTLNGSLTFFNRKPADPSVKRIKDFNFAGQVDVPLGGVNPQATFFGTVFSFAGKYQRVNGNAIALDGTVLPNTKGDIWVGQLKLTIPLDRFGLTGIKFPISATFANRTELIREREVRGNFGFSFDLDKLFLKHFLNR